MGDLHLGVKSAELYHTLRHLQSSRSLRPLDSDHPAAVGRRSQHINLWVTVGYSEPPLPIGLVPMDMFVRVVVALLAVGVLAALVLGI
jgi:hypothetical protein